MTLTKRAEQARKSLFERYDQLNALFEEAEKELTHGHLPRGVEYQYRFCEYTDDHCQPTGSGTGYAIGVQKIKGKWRLCQTEYYYPDQYSEGEYEWTPLVECSAETRVHAAEHVLSLREKIVESLERFVPKTDEALDKLKASVERLKTEDNQDTLAERAKLNGKAK